MANNRLQQWMLPLGGQVRTIPLVAPGDSTEPLEFLTIS
jgi:hypothetical protein